MAKPKKIATNTKNTKDSNTRAGKVVLDRHKGYVSKTPTKMKTMRSK
jgi:hypothetical protein